jgi:soluble lytic murein transglycosylase
MILPLKYVSFISTACEKYNVDKALVFSIVKAESGFNEKAHSNKGAKGLMQLTDETASWCAEKMGLNDFDIYDPETNINIGVWYISYLSEKTNSKDLTIISYNAGINKVNSWIDEGLVDREIKNENNIPYPETKKYLQKVRIYEKLYELRLKYNF